MDRSEQLIADSLSKHAADAPSDDRLLDGIHARLRRRRSGRAVGVVVLAAAAVATAITASHNLADPQIAQDQTQGWRWESHKTVQVQVPAEWNQYVSGAAPCTGSADRTPVIGRFNDWLGGRRLPCVVAVMPLDQRQEYLWFNDVQAPGITKYDGGWTEETRLVGGVKISVLTRDDALRERILDSARAITTTDDYGCTPRDPGDQPGALSGPVTSGDVCEYYDGSLVAGSSLPVAQAVGFDPRGANPSTQPETPATRCHVPAPRIFVVTLHTATSSWRLRISYCGDHGSLGSLLLQGPHRQSQPGDIILAPAGATPSPR
ncbi:hypothetical protein OHA10_16250 [Kribbella sp. NBC_00662]|uniref:hypothetical protein n=1 Tax=Kribbella sp. NBC_00662 TaxID=2975969 RepID=UPI003256122B